MKITLFEFFLKIYDGQKDIPNKVYMLSHEYVKALEMIKNDFENKLTDIKDIRLFGIVRGSLPMLTHMSNILDINEVGIIDFRTRDYISSEPRILTGNFDEEYVVIFDDIIDTGYTLYRILEMKELQDKKVYVFSLLRYDNLKYDITKFKNLKYLYSSYKILNEFRTWIVFPWEQLKY